MEQGRIKFLFLKWVLSNKVMWSSKCGQANVSKGIYKISFRMYLNLCNVKFSKIDVGNRIYGEVLLNLHFSIAFFNMLPRCHKLNIKLVLG